MKDFRGCLKFETLLEPRQAEHVWQTTIGVVRHAFLQKKIDQRSLLRKWRTNDRPQLFKATSKTKRPFLVTPTGMGDLKTPVHSMFEVGKRATTTQINVMAIDRRNTEISLALNIEPEALPISSTSAHFQTKAANQNSFLHATKVKVQTKVENTTSTFQEGISLRQACDLEWP